MQISRDDGKIIVSPRGATLLSWLIPWQGAWRELLLSPLDVTNNPDHLGAFIGPYAGRVGQPGNVILHGGELSYTKRDWELEQGNDFILARLSKEQVQVKYQLVEGGLDVTIFAAPKVPQALNLTTHPYFHLAPRVDELELWIPASDIIRTEHELGVEVIPIPEILDFRTSRQINQTEIDHCFMASELKVCSPDICLNMTSTYPSVVVYSYDFAQDHPKRSGLAIEPQLPINSLSYMSDDPIYHENRPLEATIQWRWSRNDGNP